MDARIINAHIVGRPNPVFGNNVSLLRKNKQTAEITTGCTNGCSLPIYLESHKHVCVCVRLRVDLFCLYFVCKLNFHFWIFRPLN